MKKLIFLFFLITTWPAYPSLEAINYWNLGSQEEAEDFALNQCQNLDEMNDCIGVYNDSYRFTQEVKKENQIIGSSRDNMENYISTDYCNGDGIDMNECIANKTKDLSKDL